MVSTYPKETFVPEKVTYTIEVDGKLTVIQNVPAGVYLETGEQLFSAETVERFQQLIFGKQKPARIMEVPELLYEERVNITNQLREVLNYWQAEVA